MKVPKNWVPRRIVVCGAGVMGTQIALHLVLCGFEVAILDQPFDGPDPSQGAKDSVKRVTRALAASKIEFWTNEHLAKLKYGSTGGDLEQWVKWSDWIIEVVFEKIEVKRPLLERIDRFLPRDRFVLVSSNTSSIPLSVLLEGLSGPIREQFVISHFFNPILLPLLELVASDELYEPLRQIATKRMGRVVVRAKDTPNFIANRIGIYAVVLAFSLVEKLGITVEELDFLTGSKFGRASSGTAGTIDIVGIDILFTLCGTLYESLVDDEERALFQVPASVSTLFERKQLGNKSGGGFYRREGKSKLVLDLKTLEYRSMVELDPELQALEAMSSSKRVRALWESRSKYGAFFREYTTRLARYAANRVPEITDDPITIEIAMGYGYNWTKGPIAMAAQVGFSRILREAPKLGLRMASWLTQPNVLGSLVSSLRKLKPVGRVVSVTKDVCRLVDLGDGVLLYELGTKAGSLGTAVMRTMNEALDMVEAGGWKGLVIANKDATVFSAGADLKEFYQVMSVGDTVSLEGAVKSFQDLMLRIRSFPYPVVAAASGRALAGGNELLVSCAKQVATVYLWTGLVEVSVLENPAGTGMLRRIMWALERAAGLELHQLQPWFIKAFEMTAMGQVSKNAWEAKRMGYLHPDAIIIASPEERISVAKSVVLAETECGYRPCIEAAEVYVPGPPVNATLRAAAYNMFDGGFIPRNMLELAYRYADILTGGDVGPTYLSVERVLEMERKAFVYNATQPETLAVIGAKFGGRAPDRRDAR